MTRGWMDGWMDGWKGEKDRLGFTSPRPHSFPVCTQRRVRQTREHEAALKLRSGEMDPARLREQHGNKLYCGNALDRIRCTPLSACGRGQGEGVKGEGWSLGSRAQ